MHFNYGIAVGVPVEDVWSFVWQVERVGACLPGCQEVKTIEPGQHYEAMVEDRIGPFKMRFTWDITVEKREPMHLIQLSARGKDRKLGATARTELTVRLAEDDSHGTSLNIDAELQVTGAVATLGYVAIKRKADQVVRQFSEALRLELEAIESRGNSA